MIESICSLIYNTKQGINYSANDLQSLMNIGNQYLLYSSLSHLTRRSFLTHTELPTVLNVFKTGGAKVQVTGHCFTNTESIPNTCKS